MRHDNPLQQPRTMTVERGEYNALCTAVDEAVRLMRTARGHYGIEEVSGPGQPATDYDELHDEMRAFVWRWGGGTDGSF